MTARGAGLAAAALLLLAAPGRATAPPVPPAFSAGTLGAPPAGWEELRFESAPRPTAYRIVADGDDRVLEAVSQDSASLLYTVVDLEPSRVEQVAWRWRVDHTTTGARLDRKRHDDAAARVYVAFLWDPHLAGPWQEMVGAWQRLGYRLAARRHGRPLPFAALCYVWADAEAPGTRLPNPYYERSVEVVLRGPDAPLGSWVEERRDVRADFVAWFGFEPPPVSHFAVMTDTDNTGSAVVAHYGDIRLPPVTVRQPPAASEHATAP